MEIRTPSPEDRGEGARGRSGRYADSPSSLGLTVLSPAGLGGLSGPLHRDQPEPSQPTMRMGGGRNGSGDCAPWFDGAGFGVRLPVVGLSPSSAASAANRRSIP